MVVLVECKILDLGCLSAFLSIVLSLFSIKIYIYMYFGFLIYLYRYSDTSLWFLTQEQQILNDAMQYIGL